MTVKVVLLEMPNFVAVMAVTPAATPVACPALIVATVAFVEPQATEAVISAVLPSLNAPVAVYCRVLPAGRLAFSGLMPIDFSVIALTVSEVEPEVAPAAEAVMVVVPALTPRAWPAGLMVAEDVDEDQAIGVETL